MRGKARAATSLLIALALLGLWVAVVAGPRARASTGDPNAWTRSETWIPSRDGTLLHTLVFRPAAVAPDTRTPVILTVSPYINTGGTTLDPTPTSTDPIGPDGALTRYGRMFERGYTYVEVALRGFGSSEGCYDFGGYGEQGDAFAAVEWAASQPWSTGKVGMTGWSYDAETQVMALATRPRGLAAVAMGAPPTGYRNIYMNGVRNTGGGHGLPAFYLASDLLPPSVFGPPVEQQHMASGMATAIAANPACYVSPLEGSVNNNPHAAYWVERDLVDRASTSDVPALWVQGFVDFQVRPPNYFPIFASKPGPHRAWLGQWDHGGTQTDGHAYTMATMAWFDRYVKGDTTAPVDDFGPVEVQDGDRHWRREASWPPADAVQHRWPLLPGTYVDGPGNSSETDLPKVLTDTVSHSPVALPTGIGTWTFTAPLPYDVRFAGVPLVDADVSTLAPNVALVALVYDVDSAGSARFVSRGATLVSHSGKVGLDLYPQDWLLPAGHRIGVLLTGSDAPWFEPGHTLTPVTVHRASLSVPALACARTQMLPSGAWEPIDVPPPFTVDAATIARRTLASPTPPPMATTGSCAAP